VTEFVLMEIKPPRKSRMQVIADRGAPPPDMWPVPNEVVLKALQKMGLLDEYSRKKIAVEYYVEGRTGKYIKDKTGISVTKARRLFERCTRKKPDGAFWGFYGCLPEQQGDPRGRHGRDLDKSPINAEYAAKGTGFKGAFTAWLDTKKGLCEKLDKFFRTRRPGDHRAPYPVLTQGTVLKGFLQLCGDAGVPPTEYPINQKRKGEWGITAYWNMWKAMHPRAAVLNQFGEDAAKEQDLDLASAQSAGAPPLPRADAYGRVELDEHLLHAAGLVSIPTRSGVDLRICVRRVWALVLRETGAGAVLATGISYREKYDKNDVLRLVRKAIKPPDKISVFAVPGLKYRAGADFPGNLPSFWRNRWQVLAFDADASHLSVADQDELRKLVSEIENEKVGSPTSHAHIESLNARLARFMQELPSGTGSNPQDPARRDPEEAAEQWSVHTHHLEQLLDVWGRNFNVTPQKALDGRTPVEMLEEMKMQGRAFISGINAFAKGGIGFEDELYKLLPSFQRNITFSRNTKERRGALGVTLFGAWYTSKEFASDPRLRSTSNLECTIHVQDDSRDAFIQPHALPGVAFKVKITTPGLKDFAHPVEWRRMTEAQGTNTVYEDMPVSISTMFDTLEGLATLAKQGDSKAVAAVSEFSGFMAQFQSGALHYVSSPEDRQYHGQGEGQGAGIDASASSPASHTREKADESQTAQPITTRRGRRPKLPAPSVEMQGATPHRPPRPSHNPFGIKL
jgi:hypothetical protein